MDNAYLVQPIPNYVNNKFNDELNYIDCYFYGIFTGNNSFKSLDNYYISKKQHWCEVDSGATLLGCRDYRVRIRTETVTGSEL